MITNLNKVAPMESFFQNCIISGDFDNELTLASLSPADYPGIFDGCYILKTDTLALKQFTHIRWSKKNDVVFKSTRYDYLKNMAFDFRPDSISPARKIGTTVSPATVAKYQLNLDLNGNIRPTENPDAGAYQWQPTK